ncbi:hypothetical protein PAL_GLEAN10020696 [Pteropus alecto]|uniref:Uncharacterized protein n=1 Tax=Pteropus alecto TaxID=9402 RepID=L5JNV2_PTEAL|nr:hypothetical protein PAL_GLEAN10020696 [Pteropus alecto]
MAPVELLVTHLALLDAVRQKGYFCEAGFLQTMVHDNINISDYCAFCTFPPGTFRGGISIIKGVISVALSRPSSPPPPGTARM